MTSAPQAYQLTIVASVTREHEQAQQRRPAAATRPAPADRAHRGKTRRACTARRTCRARRPSGRAAGASVRSAISASYSSSQQLQRFGVERLAGLGDDVHVLLARNVRRLRPSATASSCAACVASAFERERRRQLRPQPGENRAATSGDGSFSLSDFCSLAGGLVGDAARRRCSRRLGADALGASSSGPKSSPSWLSRRAPAAGLRAGPAARTAPSPRPIAR